MNSITTTTIRLMIKSDYRFTPNAPVNAELADTHFADNTAFTGTIGFEARPWQKYRIRNGNKYRGQTDRHQLLL